ncbi:MAG: hypothetical protein HDR88_11370 [Bacteroides sp.]|nr:hypothetical protein [Bacteroides sp.]
MKRKGLILKIGILIFQGIFLLAATVFSIYSQDTRSYISPTPGEFPIVASTVFNNLIGPQKSDLTDIKESGFNLCMHSSTSERFEKLLENMEGTGLKLLPHNSSFLCTENSTEEEWTEKLSAFVNKFKNNPLIAGWEFNDEPQWRELPEMKKRYDLLRALDPNRFILLNLVGELDKKYTGPCKTLSEYLDSVQTYFNLNVWSSDLYPIWIRNNKFEVRYQNFYDDLEIFSKKAKESGIPMWAYCESMEYTAKHHSRPAGTLSYLSFEAFSALAYGAQGIVYWTYWMRPPTAIEHYLSALVDLEGNRTPAWYAAKSVNSQIRALEHVFLGAELIECVHTGNISLKRIIPSLQQFGPIEKLTNEEKGVLVSHLKNGAHNYLMIVNHDVLNKQKIHIVFRKAASVTQLKVSSSGKLTKNNVKSNKNITLLPGGYSIFEWK